MKTTQLLSQWNQYPSKAFARETSISEDHIACDCSGLINLMFERLGFPLPYALARPKAVHYFNLLQEIGSNHISSLAPGSLLAWRKESPPKSGDTGHVLVVASEAEPIDTTRYTVSVYDSNKLNGGLSRREIELHTSAKGQIIGVRLQLSDKKVKHVPIYHALIEGSRYCSGCGMPRKVCLCHQLTPNLETPPIIILRHPDERKQTLATVSLIKQRYPQLLVKEGETFSPLRGDKLALVFPDTETKEASVEQTETRLETLIIIDATWRKAKKILHLNPWLQALPRVSLAPDELSEYLIRKVPEAGALSTVETFAQLTKDVTLSRLFSTFMTKQIEVIGKDVYEKNYRNHLNFKHDQ